MLFFWFYFLIELNFGVIDCRGNSMPGTGLYSTLLLGARPQKYYLKFWDKNFYRSCDRCVRNSTGGRVHRRNDGKRLGREKPEWAWEKTKRKILTLKGLFQGTKFELTSSLFSCISMCVFSNSLLQIIEPFMSSNIRNECTALGRLGASLLCSRDNAAVGADRLAE